MHVVIHSLEAHKIEVTKAAQNAVRLSFNPSGDARVERLKALAAAFISECDDIAHDIREAGARNGPSLAGSAVDEALRAFAVAKTNMQQASMWAVLGATAPAAVEGR